MANAFSNPAHYAQFKPVQTENWEVATQLAMFKRAEYDKGQAEVDQWINALASVPIDNKEANAHFRDRVSTVLSEVDRMASAESLTNKGSRQKILSNIASAVDDITLNAISASRAKRNYDAQWEAIKKEKGDFYNNTNYAYGKAGYDEYINAKKDADVGDFVKNGFRIIPYKNLSEQAQKNTMEIIKQKGKREILKPITQKITQPDGTEVEQVIGHETITEVGLDDADLRKVLSATFNDEASVAQMEVNSWAKYGGYSKEGVAKLREESQKYNEDLVDEYTSNLERLKNEMSIAGEKDKPAYEAKVKDLEEAISNIKIQSTKDLESIDKGQYRNPALKIVNNDLIKSEKLKFSSLHDVYRSKVQADELFWKQQDYNFKLLELEETKRKNNLTAQSDKTGSGNGIDTGIPINMVDEAVVLGDIEPEKAMQKVLGDMNVKRRERTIEFAKIASEQLDPDNPDVKVREEAERLKNSYIDTLYNANKKAGSKINRDYMKTLNITEILSKYDQYGTTFATVALMNKNSLGKLRVVSGEDELQQLEAITNNYKGIKNASDTANNEYVKLRQESTFKPEFFKTAMKNKATILVDGKVVTADKYLEKYINYEKGTFKDGVTPEEKVKIMNAVEHTRDIQKTSLGEDYKNNRGTTNKEALERTVKLIGGNVEDIGSFVSDRGVKSYMVRYDTETLKKLEKMLPILNNNTFKTGSTNFAKDGVYDQWFVNSETLAKKYKEEVYNKIIGTTLYTDKQAVIPIKTNDGKTNADALALARIVNAETGQDVTLNDSSVIKIKEGSNKTYTITYNTKEHDGTREVAVQKTLVVDNSRLQQYAPEVSQKLGVGKEQKVPIHTFEAHGFKPTFFQLRPYFSAEDDSRAMEVYSKGDASIMSQLTKEGSLSHMLTNPLLAPIFQKTEGLKEAVFSKLDDMHKNYRISTNINSGKDTAEIALVNSNGEKLAVIKKPLINGGMDEIFRTNEATPMLAINELISKVIYDNYHNSAGMYNKKGYKELFGELKPTK